MLIVDVYSSRKWIFEIKKFYIKVFLDKTTPSSWKMASANFLHRPPGLVFPHHFQSFLSSWSKKEILVLKISRIDWLSHLRIKVQALKFEKFYRKRWPALKKNPVWFWPEKRNHINSFKSNDCSSQVWVENLRMKFKSNFM